MSTAIKGVVLKEKHERMVRLLLSVRAHAPLSAHAHALRLVYTEMVLSGAGKYTREEWQDALGTIGADIRVSLDAGDIDISLRALDTTLPKAITLFTTCMSKPTFHADELVRIKTYIAHNLERAKDDAKLHAYQGFIAQVCGEGDRRNMYSIDVILKEVKRITIQEIQSFHASLWNYEWLYTIGGSEETGEQCVRMLEKLRKLNRGVAASAYAPVMMRQASGVQLHLHSVPHKQNIEFSIGNAVPLLRTDAQYPAFVFGMSVLGLHGGFTGRLMSIVREKEGLTYGIYGRVEEVTTQENGVWRIATFFSPKDAEKGITSVLREIARIARDGITEDELIRFKTILHTRYALIQDSLLKRVGEAHGLMKLGVDGDEYRAFKKAILALTKEEVDDALRTYLDSKNLIISGAGPTDGVKKELMKFAG